MNTSIRINEEILVKNAAEDSDTKATIIHQNNIDYTPKVSVIIPVYNTEKYLRECLDSVINQTLKEIEIICVDDGSTDSSLNILKEYANKDNRFTIITQQNLHAGVARNAGLTVVKGEYVSFLDSDDYIKFEYLEKLYNKIVLEKADICICKKFILDSRTNIVKEDDNSLKINMLPLKSTFAMDDIYSNLFQFCDIAVWMKLYSRNFLQLNNIRFQNTKNINDTYFNHVSLMLANSITYLNEHLIVYRFFNKTSLTFSRGKDINILIKVYKEIINTAKRKNIFHKIEESLYKRMISSARYELSLCTDVNKKVEMEKTLMEFLPKKYSSFLAKNKPLIWYQYFFSIKNDDRFHKIITILGVKITIKNNKKIFRHFFDKLEKHLCDTSFIEKRAINKEKVQYEINKMKKSGVEKTTRNPKIIVSLTSYPDRMYDIHYTIFSLLTQTIKPDKVVLYLAEEQFPEKENDIGENVLNLKKYGLTISWVKNDIKSYKKLIPALNEYPNDIIVTADDDLYYESTWLENLYNTYLNGNKNCIIANRCHRIIMKNDKIMPYKSWDFCIFDDKASFLNFPTTGGGVLYPPNLLHKDIFNEEKFLKIAPSADDIYFWAMAVLNKIKVKISENKMNNITYINAKRELGLNNDGTLWAQNLKSEFGNDFYIDNIVKQYPQIMEYIKEEISFKNIK